MLRPNLYNRDFGKALRFTRQTLRLNKADYSAVTSGQYLSSLERRAESPSLSMVEKIAGVMEIHPLTLLTLAYSQGEADDDSLEMLLTQVRSQIVGLRSQATLAAARKVDAMKRLQKHLQTHAKRMKLVAPQTLIDQAFSNDDEAIAWFKDRGMTLVPGRLQGLPGLANIFRNVSPTNEDW